MEKKKIIIDGNICNDQKDFWDIYASQIDIENGRFTFGKNLDAFNDAITGGGPGFPGEAIIQISGTENLKSIFCDKKFQYIIDLLNEANNIELLLLD